MILATVIGGWDYDVFLFSHPLTCTLILVYDEPIVSDYGPRGYDLTINILHHYRKITIADDDSDVDLVFVINGVSGYPLYATTTLVDDFINSRYISQ
jgi:hypothetical protein